MRAFNESALAGKTPTTAVVPARATSETTADASRKEPRRRNERRGGTGRRTPSSVTPPAGLAVGFGRGRTIRPTTSTPDLRRRGRFTPKGNVGPRLHLMDSAVRP